MRIRIGYDLAYECPQPTPMLLMLSIHPSRLPELVVPDDLVTEPVGPVRHYEDAFGNRCTRILAPSGRIRLFANGVVIDPGEPDAVAPAAAQHPVQDLPDEALVFLLSSRYCETDHLSDTAWALFGHTAPGWPRVAAICDYVHRHLRFGYEHARPTRSAVEAHRERVGVCRDFAHLAIAFCRCMNIPARYCTGYLGDIGVPPDPAPMDFSAWFEAYLGDAWYSFDARHNKPRIGRILMARGRDAADVAISTTFGPNKLVGFSVVTEEIRSP
ncbi:MAG TPA: transglutaminase family protein [Stellaceae bacterium]|nr:transglutaminase family protein [Stellaceae bacterium]